MNLSRILHFSLPVIFIAGVLLSCASGWLLSEAEEEAVIIEFKNEVDDRAASFYRELLINFETLRSLAILFSDKEKIPDYEQFRTEAQRILSRHSDIQALEWIPKVLHSRRVQHENEIKRYYPDYEISERQEQGLMVLAKEREEYYPVYFVAPISGNEAALGFDLASNDKRFKTLQESRDRAIPLATSAITLVQGNEQKKGFLAFLPIYEGRPQTVSRRHESLVGFVLGVFRIEAIFVNSILNNRAFGIDMELVDKTSSGEEEILYSHVSRTASPARKDIVYKKDLPPVWGRTWGLNTSPTANYVNGRKSTLPWVVSFVGIVFTVIVTSYLKMMATRTVTIEEKVVQKTLELQKANKKLEQLSRSDGLTKIANRRWMDQFLQDEWARAIRNNSYLSFILIDIDYFKLFNDNYGHLKGDECLKLVASKLTEVVRRPADLLARYGGEEFAVVLPETENAGVVAEECKKAVESLQIPHVFSEVAEVLTISVGYCVFLPANGTEPNLIIDAADKALYLAKENGRNRVVEQAISG